MYLSFHGNVIPNHGYAVIDDISFENAVLCHTDLPTQFRGYALHSGGNWFAPDGTRVNEHDVPGFTRNREPMVVRLVKTETSANQGIYKCSIQDAKREQQSVYIGLYYQGYGRKILKHNCYS